MSELWVDTDLGFDDIHALLLLHCHGIRPVAHSLVFGCSTLDQVITNAQGVESAFGFDSAWHSGAASALDGEYRTATHVLGELGMLSRGLNLPMIETGSDTFLQHESAVEGMINWLSGKPIDPHILALGPLTNLAQLIIKAPSVAATLSQITWMGGSSGRGNQTEHAEFNAWADAEAAAIVMQSGIAVCIVELEACRKLQLVPADLKPLWELQNPKAQLLHDLLGGYLDIALSRGRASMSLYDPLAAAAVILAMGKTSCNNDILSTTPVNITVETVDNAECDQSGRTHIIPATAGTEGEHLTEPVHTLCVVNNADAVHNMLIDALYKTAKEAVRDHS